MTNISEIISVLQTDLRKKGIHYLSQARVVNDNLMVTCPYHKDGMEHSPSCGILLKDRGTQTKVYKSGTVHCFTCGATHSLEEMISHVFGHEDKGDYGREWLLEHFNILSTQDIVFDITIMFRHEEKPEVEYKQFTDVYHPYLETRGIPRHIAKAFNLGYDDFTDSITIPLFDKDGKCIMLMKRSVTEHAYMNTSGANKTDSLFGLSIVYEKMNKLVNKPYLFIVEGPFDAIRMWQHGLPAVGIMQAAISEKQLNLVRKLPFNKIVIATDNDQAGNAVADKLADKLKDKEVYRLVFPKGVKDPGEMTDEQYKSMELKRYGKPKSAFSI